MEKIELVASALQQRIGEIVATYESQIAVLRAEVTVLLNEKQEREKAVQEYKDSLNIESD